MEEKISEILEAKLEDKVTIRQATTDYSYIEWTTYQGNMDDKEFLLYVLDKAQSLERAYMKPEQHQSPMPLSNPAPAETFNPAPVPDVPVTMPTSNSQEARRDISVPGQCVHARYWDNRENKKSPKSPDFACKDCGAVMWLRPDGRSGDWKPGRAK